MSFGPSRIHSRRSEVRRRRRNGRCGSPNARLAHQVAAELLDRGIYVVGFSYPVVPRGAARIRVQISAAHEPAHLERAVAAFVEVGRAHAVI
jgi:glycine C-acetyltransferase